MIKKIILAAIAALGVACAAQAQTWYPAEWNFINNISYKLYDDGHAEVANSDWSIVDVTIPATITANGRTYNVTKVGDNAFSNRGAITSITIEGENLESIGANAFLNAGCNAGGISEVNFPGSLREVGNDAFNTAKIVHICFSKLTEAHTDLNIHTHAFYGCQYLQTIELYCNIVGKEAFKDCQYFKTLVIGKNVEKICESAFENCRMIETIIVGRQEPPVCEKDAFLGVGYTHVTPEVTTQIENNGYDEKGVYHGTEGARGKYGNYLHYVNVKLAINDYGKFYPEYRDYPAVAYTDENGATKYSYQEWDKDRTNQYYIEFIPNEDTGVNDGWIIDGGQLNGFGGDPWQRKEANFYYSPMTYDEVLIAKDRGLVKDLEEFEIYDYVTGVENVAKDAETAKVFATEGNIHIVADGVNKVDVYTISGSKVYSGYDDVVNVPAGLYIVKVLNKTSKILVK